ncbi:hypothetical protein [Dactylosporangium sp. CA-139066]|uniref:hypothetical protein n=1 Tax=Dactylosporangium sp. CA-139066 TaxID=3239930 RepID=UPI003D944C3E
MSESATYTTTWYDLYHHLAATGGTMTVRGVPEQLDCEPIEWVASARGLNRYDGDGESTATWYPDAGDVLLAPESIPVQPRKPRCADGVAEAARLLRQAAEGRLEYLASCPDQRARDVLETEASTLRHAADVVEGDLTPLYGWLPSWRWTDEMTAAAREQS